MNTLYRLVLLAFPEDFRRHHGAAMAQQFDEQRRAAKSRPVAHLTLWPRAIIDAVRHGLGQRMQGPEQAPRPSTFSPDLRQAWRSVMSRKTSAAISVALLAVALTVSTSIFSLVDALLLRPAPYPQSQNLYDIYSAQNATKLGVPYMPAPLVRAWAVRTDLFSAVGAYAQGGTALIGGGETTREAVGQVYADPGLFAVIGVRPLAGRTFSADDVRPGNDQVIVIDESIWQSRFNRDPGAIGQPLLVNGVPMTVLGVMPEQFGYPRHNIKLWRPLDLSPGGGVRNPQPLARGRSDLSRAALQAGVGAAATGIMAQGESRFRSAALRPMDESHLDQPTRQSIWLLAGATLLLLVTAGANLSSLTMTQMLARTRQVAIQSALGASRFRLVRQALLEQCLIALGALAIAVPLTSLALSAAPTLMPDRFTAWTMHLANFDLRAGLLMGLLAFGTPILASLIPAMAGSRASVVELLKQDTRSSTAGRGSRALRQLLVVTEIVCAVVLLVGGALLVRSFLRLQAVDRGFDTSRLAYAWIEFPAREFPSPLSRRLYIDRAMTEIAAATGITAVTIGSGLPPHSGQINFGNIALDGQPTGTVNLALPAYIVSPDFFSITGIPIVQGRSFQPDDPATSVIVSQSFASAFWGGTSPVGHRFRLDDSSPWKDVVGVAGEVKSDGLDDARTPFEAYYPYIRPAATSLSSAPVASSDTYSGQTMLVIRAGDARSAVPVVRSALLRVDSRVMIQQLEAVEDLYGDTLQQPRMLLWLMVAFSAAGLLVAAVGVYGVLSSLVAQQFREIAVRLMLGAEPAAMSRTVFRGGLSLAAIGAAIGVVSAALASRWIGSVLFGVQPTDVTSYAVVIVVLASAAIAAAWIPARRAASVDPAALLREG
jgi:predicted permease